MVDKWAEEDRPAMIWLGANGDEPRLTTSGTTKHPKGALHTHGYTHAKWMEVRYRLDLQEGDRLWCTSGTGWAKSVWNVYLGPWSLGTEIVLHEDGFAPAERLDLMTRHDITVLCQARPNTASSPKGPSWSRRISPASGTPSPQASR